MKYVRIHMLLLDGTTACGKLGLEAEASRDTKQVNCRLCRATDRFAQAGRAEQATQGD